MIYSWQVVVHMISRLTRSCVKVRHREASNNFTDGRVDKHNACYVQDAWTYVKLDREKSAVQFHRWQGG